RRVAIIRLMVELSSTSNRRRDAISPSLLRRPGAGGFRRPPCPPPGGRRDGPRVLPWWFPITIKGDGGNCLGGMVLGRSAAQGGAQLPGAVEDPLQVGLGAGAGVGPEAVVERREPGVLGGAVAAPAPHPTP